MQDLALRPSSCNFFATSTAVSDLPTAVGPFGNGTTGSVRHNRIRACNHYDQSLQRRLEDRLSAMLHFRRDMNLGCAWDQFKGYKPKCKRNGGILLARPLLQ